MNSEPPRRDPLVSGKEPILAQMVGPPPAGKGNSPSQFSAAGDLPGQQLPPTPPIWPIVGCAAVALCFVFVLVIAVVVLTSELGSNIASSLNGSVPALPSLARQDIPAVLDGRWRVSDDDPRYQEIRDLLKRLEAAVADDDESLEAMVDWPTRMKRFESVYRFKPIRWWERLDLLQMEQDDFQLSEYASQFRIAAVVEPTENDWFVYTYAQAGELAHTPYIFHFRRSDGTWRFVDSMEVPELRWSAENSSYQCGPTTTDRSCINQAALTELVNEAHAQIEQGDYESAERSLRSAETLAGVPQLHDSNLHMIAVGWSCLNKYDDVLRVYQRVHDADTYPWIHFLTAETYYSRDEYQPALHAITRYERVAGFDYDLAQLKVQCQAKLEHADVGNTALALLRYAPRDDEALSLALSHLPPERIEEAVALLPDDANTIDRLASSAESLLYQDNLPSYESLRAMVADRHPDSVTLLWMDARWLHYQGKLQEAVEKYERLLPRLTDDEQRTSAGYEYAEVGLKTLDVVQLYRRSTQPRQLLETLTEGIADGQAWITVDQLAGIVPDHQQGDPQDPRLPFYAAVVAQEQEDLSTALAQYQGALTLLGDDDERAESLRYSLRYVHYQLGQWLEGYQESVDKAKAFQQLAALAETDGDWTALGQLCHAHRQIDAGDLLLRYYDLLLREQQAAQANDAEELGQILAGYQTLGQENETAQRIYPYLINGRINRLAARRDQWQVMLRQRPDPDEVFPYLVSRFQGESNEQSLREMIAWYRTQFPDSIALLRHDLEQLWHARDYAAYIQRLTPWPEVDYRRGYFPEYEARPRYAISHLMLGQLDAASDAAAKWDSINTTMMLNLASQDEQAVRAFLSEHYKSLYMTHPPGEDWLLVPAISEFVRSDTYRRIQADFPPTIDESSAEFRSVLLCSADRDWSASAIQQRLVELGLHDIQVQALSPLSTGSRTFRLTSTGDSALLTVGSGRYPAETWVASNMSSMAESRDAWQNHQSWAALESMAGSTATSSISVAWHRVVAACAGTGDFLWTDAPHRDSYLGILDADTLAKLGRGTSELAILKPASEVWLPVANAEDTESDAEIRRRWRGRCEKAAASTEPAGRIKIRLRHGSAVEEAWLTVTRVEHQHWGDYVVIGQLEQASSLNPYLDAGMTFKVDLEEVRDWRDPPE